MDLILVGAYVFALVLGFALPQRRLPTLALVIFTLVPSEYLLQSWFFLSLSPATVVLIIWLMRSLRPPRRQPSEGRRFGAAEYFLLIFAVLLAINLLFVHPGTLESGTATWTISVAVNVIVIPLIARFARLQGLQELPRAWVTLGGALGLFAILEKYVFVANPLYGNIFSDPTLGLQHGWASYRVTTTLGHPLLNSAFFGVAVAIGIGILIKRFSGAVLACTVLSVIGVLCTVSRSGIIALSVVTAFMLLAGLLKSGRATARMVLVLIPIAAVGSSVFSDVMTERLGSGEAASSVNYRNIITTGALQAISRFPTWGFGPAGLSKSSSAVNLPNMGNYENSWLDLGVALGVVAAVVLSITLAAYGIRALRKGDLTSAGALVAYVVAFSSFNLFFGHAPWSLILGLLLLMAGSSPTIGGIVLAPQRKEPLRQRTRVNRRAQQPQNSRRD